VSTTTVQLPFTGGPHSSGTFVGSATWHVWGLAVRSARMGAGLCERHMRVSALPTLLLAPLHSHDCTATGRKPCSGSRCSERTLLWAVAAWGPGRCSRSPAKAHQVPWCTPAPPSPSPLASPTHPLSPPPLPSFR
jgi:hypothetical protein